MIPSQLPTEADLRGAYADLLKAVESYLHVWWLVQRIARAHDEEDYPEHALVSGDERPTFALTLVDADPEFASLAAAHCRLVTGWRSSHG
jgi:hypothetical protein